MIDAPQGGTEGDALAGSNAGWRQISHNDAATGFAYIGHHLMMSARPVLTVDARQSPRKAVNWPARLMREGGSIVECRAVDSSVGGVGLVTQVPMRVDELVQVALRIPGDVGGFQLRVVVHHGRIVMSVLTSAGFRVGLKLADPTLDLVNAVA